MLLQASSPAVARHHHEPDDPCRHGSGLLRHKDHHRCSSPPVSHKGGGTRAVMTVNGFRKGEEGGAPRSATASSTTDREMIVALSTGWYAGGERCHKPIRITSEHNGRSVVARVVDECDSRHGCKNNIVDTSKAVWDALGLDTKIGQVPDVWFDA
ncbi:putative ripening-related protein 6 [Dichanthelium oligosanthes]|uniref:Putative ripening-related protein 6 n=1 Tax=Dichanthelium oligosanthes TaxID=888268 RepID=A0A1E5UNF9_9POAL|nr:putative ripening-related protein 6 [Dichanthelium oligosanthes]